MNIFIQTSNFIKLHMYFFHPWPPTPIEWFLNNCFTIWWRWLEISALHRVLLIPALPPHMCGTVNTLISHESLVVPSSRRRVNFLPKYINCRHYKFLLTLLLFSIVDTSGKTGHSLNVVLLADINRITTITDRRCSSAVLSNQVSDNRLFTSHLLFISSPEHEVLMVSYCGQWLSVVRRRASSVVRRETWSEYLFWQYLGQVRIWVMSGQKLGHQVKS